MSNWLNTNDMADGALLGAKTGNWNDGDTLRAQRKEQRGEELSTADKLSQEKSRSEGRLISDYKFY